ncbi:hypothetical protein TYRP_005566 [Tyrophagus putrescentiae]|nr:hypothetical protein TYRP_005566 [Tyrophagus putrescentiae]
MKIPMNIKPQHQYLYDAAIKKWSIQPRTYPANSLQDVCSICLEVTATKLIDRQLEHSRYGMLENCSHVFCGECLETWMKEGPGPSYECLIRCPYCQTLSEKYLLHSSYVTDKAVRESLFSSPQYH